MLKTFVHLLVPLRWRFALRRLNRFRFVAKHRAYRRAGAHVRRSPARYLRYILLDPELDNYTFELADEAQHARAVAAATGATPARVEALFRELRDDLVFRRDVTTATRRRLDVKRRPPLGRRLGWYALVRLLRPALVLECGVLDGFGSLVLLRALERNAEEGHGGELLSVDAAPGAGWMVPDRLRDHWQLVTANIDEALLDELLDGAKVDLLLEDTGAGYDVERASYEAALRHGGEHLVVVSASAQITTALKDLAAERGLATWEADGRPLDHFYPAVPTVVCVPAARVRSLDVTGGG